MRLSRQIGETARSIVNRCSKKTLGRDPVASEVESYLHEVREINDDIENLKPRRRLFATQWITSTPLVIRCANRDQHQM